MSRITEKSASTDRDGNRTIDITRSDGSRQHTTVNRDGDIRVTTISNTGKEITGDGARNSFTPGYHRTNKD